MSGHLNLNELDRALLLDALRRPRPEGKKGDRPGLNRAEMRRLGSVLRALDVDGWDQAIDDRRAEAEAAGTRCATCGAGNGDVAVNRWVNSLRPDGESRQYTMEAADLEYLADEIDRMDTAAEFPRRTAHIWASLTDKILTAKRKATEAPGNGHGDAREAPAQP